MQTAVARAAIGAKFLVDVFVLVRSELTRPTQLPQGLAARQRRDGIPPLLVHQQALAEIASHRKIQVLLAHDLRLAQRHEAQLQLHIAAIVGRNFAEGFGVAHIGQPRLGGDIGELHQIAGRVEALQVLVRDVVIRLLA